MLRIYISAEWLFSLGLIIAMASAWAWVASAQVGYAPGISLAVIGSAASLALMTVGGRRM